jgi:hypothetical protein
MAHHSVRSKPYVFTGRPHVGIPRGPVPIPACVACGETIRARGHYRYHLSARELAEIDAGLAQAAATGKPTIELTAQDLQLPTLSKQIGRCRMHNATASASSTSAACRSGGGRWIPPGRFFWAFGAHLGTPGLRILKATCGSRHRYRRAATDPG